MNPVLLKPQSDVGAQVIVRGRLDSTLSARDFQARKRALLGVAVESFRLLDAQADLVLVEGAGSPAETNLRENDIANMGFANAADLPVALVGDIDRGHVIAALVGAHTVLDAADRDRIAGFIVNKFRGDPSLFDTGRREIAARTGWRDLGMAPFLPIACNLPAEDATALARSDLRPGPASGGGAGRVRIVALRLPRIANFDDFDALAAEPQVDFAFVPPGTALPGDADLVILPGTKATLADLAFLMAQGWDIDLRAHVRRGGRVLGICGGYQMLGTHVADPHGIEGPPGGAEGLGMLDVRTVLAGDKTLRRVTGRLQDPGAPGAALSAYEIHVGETTGPATARPFAHLDGVGPDGAISPDGRVAGCYLHGLFDAPSARAALLAPLGATSDGVDPRARVDAALDEIAASLATCLDIDAIARIAGL